MMRSHWLRLVLLVLAGGSPALPAQATTLTGSVTFGAPVPFIVPVTAGNSVTVSVSSNPDVSHTQLNFYDASANLIGTANSNQGDGLSAILTSLPILSSGDSLVTVVDPNSGSFNFTLSVTGNTGGSAFGPVEAFTGSASSGSPAGFIIPVNAGDNLTMFLGTSATQTQLNVFDPSNNLVGTATSDPFDGYSATLQSVPNSTGGNAVIDVADPISGSFNFTLFVFGNTGGVGSPVPAVPEPGTLVLFGSGLLALGGYIRRRRNIAVVIYSRDSQQQHNAIRNT